MSFEVDLENLRQLSKTLRGLANESTGISADGVPPTMSLPFGLGANAPGTLKSVAEASKLSADAQKEMRSAIVERLDDVSAVMRSVVKKYENTEGATVASIVQAYNQGLPEWKVPGR